MTALIVCLCVIGWLAAALFVLIMALFIRAMCHVSTSADRHIGSKPPQE